MREAKRLHSIHGYLTRIVPSFTQRVELSRRPPQLGWALYGTGQGPVWAVLTVEGVAIAGSIVFPNGELALGPTAIAVRVHTDDEIARKFVVFALGYMHALAEGARKAGDTETAQVMRSRHDRMFAELEAWGRGTTAAYTG
ncbi:MAG: hypothetical protein ACOYY2_13930 [Actinomycetota bacterium]